MAKYGKKIKERIMELIKSDAYSVSEICEFAGISRKTFYEWKNTMPEFSEAIAEAQGQCDEALVVKARHALNLKLDGYKATTTTYKYVPDEYDGLQLKEKMVRVCECPPDMRTIMLVLDRDEKKQGQSDEKQEEKKPIILTVKTEEEREKYQPVVDEFIAKLKTNNEKRKTKATSLNM